MPWYFSNTNSLFMKITVLFIVISLFTLVPVFSQKVESLHSVKAGFPTITYSYEHAIGKQVTINLETGVNWSWQYSNNHTKLSFSPVLRVEPRIYYNVNRRFKNDRFNNNSASFFCATASIEPTIFEEDHRSVLSIIPKWGFRRALGNNFIFEPQIGAGMYFYRKSTLFAPGLDIKFGYLF